VIPMREELVRAGIQETRTAEDVDATLARPGTTLLVVNSICGCAAGKMRPGVRLALTNAAHQPDHKITVFAGQDKDATVKARGYLKGYPPSSPAMALIRNGEVLFMLQRYQIEGRTAEAVGQMLSEGFAKAVQEIKNERLLHLDLFMRPL